MVQQVLVLATTRESTEAGTCTRNTLMVGQVADIGESLLEAVSQQQTQQTPPQGRREPTPESCSHSINT